MSLWSVSYTHLDVYKRQVLRFVNCICKFCEENNFADIRFQEKYLCLLDLKLSQVEAKQYLGQQLSLGSSDTSEWQFAQCICVVRWLSYFKLLFLEFVFNISTSWFLFSLLVKNYSWPTERGVTSAMLNFGLMFAYYRCCSDFLYCKDYLIHRRRLLQS